jgi:hypothetical protein
LEASRVTRASMLEPEGYAGGRSKKSLGLEAAGKYAALGWHTVRHSYRSWLDETGAPMKVQQELMRHASIQTTMNVYGQAMSSSKREANSKVVEMAVKPVAARPERRFCLWGVFGSLSERPDLRKLLKDLVAGAGFEPATFGL